MLWKKGLTVCVTVLFVEICLVLLRSSDSPFDFVPLVDTVQRGCKSISAYDFFLAVAVLTLRVLFIHCGVNPLSELQNFKGLLRHVKLMDVVVIIGSGVLTHYSIWPLFQQILREPLRVLQSSSDSIRQTVIVISPVVWLFLVGLVNRGSSNVPAQVQAHTQALPTAPQW